MERSIVACYAAVDGGHFTPHRDNSSKAPRTANSLFRST